MRYVLAVLYAMIGSYFVAKGMIGVNESFLDRAGHSWYDIFPISIGIVTFIAAVAFALKRRWGRHILLGVTLYLLLMTIQAFYLSLTLVPLEREALSPIFWSNSLLILAILTMGCAVFFVRLENTSGNV